MARWGTPAGPQCAGGAIAILAVLASAAFAGETRQLVNAARAVAEPLEREYLPLAIETAKTAIGRSARMPAIGKLSLHGAIVEDRWRGLAALESVGERLSLAARSDGVDRRIVAGAHVLLQALGRADESAAGAFVADAAGAAADAADWLAATVSNAAALVEEALAPLPPAHRTNMVIWAPRMIAGYRPQLPVNDATRPHLQNDAAFVALAGSIRWASFEAALARLASLASSSSVTRIREAWREARPLGRPVAGVSGDVLFETNTPCGRILIGGAGPNRYDDAADAALIVDLGGDDEYSGPIAAAVAGRPVAMVLDVAGRDRHEARGRGLGSGWLGVGLLVDLEGDDTYGVGAGGGGLGAGGIGVVCDAAGDDTIEATAFSVGIGFAGVGLWLDLGGDDRYAAQAFAMGLGGPSGAAALVDAAGADHYRCGFAVSSGYNAAEHPEAKPGDPRFQYDAFGLGMGLGRRVLSENAADHHALALAGGLGIVLDLAGHDRYQASNFALGCGYYFGIGLAMDLEGDDTWTCARYGLGAGAHMGVALCLDGGGRDRYATTGPTYAGGCAWDGTLSLMVEAAGDDEYSLAAGDGPALADIGLWGAFVELSGDDRYELRDAPGRATRDAAAVFADAAGRDTWTIGAGRIMTNGLRAAQGGALRADLGD